MKNNKNIKEVYNRVLKWTHEEVKRIGLYNNKNKREKKRDDEDLDKRE